MTVPNVPSNQGPDATQQQNPNPDPQQQNPNPDPQPQPDPAPQPQQPNPAPQPQQPETPQHEQYPEDHPLVRTLEAQKAEIRELKSKDAAKVAVDVAAALKAHLVELHSIGDDDAELLLTSTDPDVLVKQVNRLLGQSAEPRPRNNPVPREGGNPQPKPASDMREFARTVFGNTD